MLNQQNAQVTVTVDVIIPRLIENDVTGYDTEILLIQRKRAPYEGMWAFPGGKLNADDATLQDAAYREVREETGINLSFLYQVAAYGDSGRDPRGRFISVVYASLFLPDNEIPFQAGDDAERVQWFSLKQLPPLAFDHTRILQEHYTYLRDV